MAINDIAEYKTFVFDCDGVILDSNRLKTDAFYETTFVYGEAIASFFVEYHRQHGGISRYHKFDYFFSNILQREPHEGEMNHLLSEYARHVSDGLLSCNITDGLYELRTLTLNSRWLIVSGGDQDELRRVFAERKLSQLFDGGIYGGPDSKDEILVREINNGNIQNPCVFIGDSRYDHQSSEKIGMDFIFITQWTEFQDWKEYFSSVDVKILKNIACLC